MKLSITSILISSASIAIVSAQTNKTLAPTVSVTRPDTPSPITPFPTESPRPVSLCLMLCMLFASDVGVVISLFD